MACAAWPAIYPACLYALCASFLVSSAIIVRTHKLSSLTSSHAPMLIFRGSLLMGSTILNFFAVRYLPLTLTSTILFSAPLMACMLSQPMLAEKVGLFRWTAVLFRFAGVIIAIRPFDESFHWAAVIVAWRCILLCALCTSDTQICRAG